MELTCTSVSATQAVAGVFLPPSGTKSAHSGEHCSHLVGEFLYSSLVFPEPLHSLGVTFLFILNLSFKLTDL